MEPVNGTISVISLPITTFLISFLRLSQGAEWPEPDTCPVPLMLSVPSDVSFHVVLSPQLPLSTTVAAHAVSTSPSGSMVSTITAANRMDSSLFFNLIFPFLVPARHIFGFIIAVFHEKARCTAAIFRPFDRYLPARAGKIFFRWIRHFCRKTDSFSVFVVVVSPKLLYNSRGKNRQYAENMRRNTE